MTRRNKTYLTIVKITEKAQAARVTQRALLAELFESAAYHAVEHGNGEGLAVILQFSRETTQAGKHVRGAIRETMPFVKISKDKETEQTKVTCAGWKDAGLSINDIPSLWDIEVTPKDAEPKPVKLLSDLMKLIDKATKRGCDNPELLALLDKLTQKTVTDKLTGLDMATGTVNTEPETVDVWQVAKSLVQAVPTKEAVN